MHALVDDLLAYARVGHSGRAPERVDVGELVHRLVADRAAGAVLEIGDLPVVLARPREFEQLLANLIANGVKFVAPGVKPRVSVIGGARGRGWRFEIADNGIGVAAPHAQRIFGMFARSPAGEQYPGPASASRSPRKSSRRRVGGSGCGRATAAVACSASPGPGSRESNPAARLFGHVDKEPRGAPPRVRRAVSILRRTTPECRPAPVRPMSPPPSGARTAAPLARRT